MISLRRPSVARACALGVTLALLAACGKKDADTAQTSSGSIGAGSTTSTAGALRVADITVGRGVGADKRISVESSEFRPADTIFVSVHTTGVASGTPLTARWSFQDGQQVDERTETISPTGDAYTEFHVAKASGWPAGRYTVRILLNGQEAASKEFTVKR